MKLRYLGSIKSRLFLLLAIVTALPVFVSGYFITVSAEKALVVEKQQKLFGAAKLLDQYLTTSYSDILRTNNMQNTDHHTQVTVLNQELKKYTDEVASVYPGIGVGYYDRDLDAIITYGPSEIYADKVGLPIADTHEGRIVMETGLPRVQEGNLVRGPVMNAMYPVIRDGAVIGYIWANELMADIQEQVGEMKNHIYWLILVNLAVGIGGVIYIVNRLVADINRIKSGLLRLKNDMSYRLPKFTGEIGEISAAINDMANNLATKKMLEEKMQRADRLAAIGEMAAGLAHEIRNPLMAIKGFTQLLSEPITTDEHVEFTSIIVRETERMDLLIEQLLCLTRPTIVVVMPTDVHVVLKNTLKLLETEMLRREIRIVQTFAEPIPLILADSEQLKQVFFNLILNAIQAIDKQGAIFISTEHHPFKQEVLIRIEDTGAGIQPENITKLFDPFFTTKENGTGLGLSVAQHLMLNWGGNISVESVINQGTVFTLTFPVAGGDTI